MLLEGSGLQGQWDVGQRSSKEAEKSGTSRIEGKVWLGPQKLQVQTEGLMLAILGCCCQAGPSSCHWGMGGTASPLLPAWPPSLAEQPERSLQAPLEAASFVLQTEAPILCSQSVCSKDKPQENSCCLLTLTVRIIGK